MVVSTIPHFPRGATVYCCNFIAFIVVFKCMKNKEKGEIVGKIINVELTDVQYEVIKKLAEREGRSIRRQAAYLMNKAAREAEVSTNG